MNWSNLYNFFLPFLAAAGFTAALGSARGRSWLAENTQREFLRQRRGLSGFNPAAQIWIHAASVGELRSLARFLEFLKKNKPGVVVHMTCMTSSGLEFIRRDLFKNSLADSVSLVPFDFYSGVSRYLNGMKRLKVLVIAETELWPNLIFQAKKKGVSLFWLNARMSKKTGRWLKLVPGLARRIFSSFDRAAFSTESAKDLFLSYGGKAERAIVAGNLKWDMEAPGGLRGEAQNLKRLWLVGEEDFVWVCGSLRRGEEDAILRSFKNLRARHQNLRLVLVPRHLEDARYFSQAAGRFGLSQALHSELSSSYHAVSLPSSTSRVRGEKVETVLVDRMGILWPCYAAASAVFVGGTLVDGIGGHNFLEPAALGKAIVMGPYFENYTEVVELFRARQAVSVALSSADLEKRLEGWISRQEEAKAAGARAWEVFKSSQGASEKSWKLLEPLL